MVKMLQDDWQEEYKYAGSFQTALMRAIEKADHINLAKLEKAFPNIVEAFRKWRGY